MKREYIVRGLVVLVLLIDPNRSCAKNKILENITLFTFVKWIR